MKSSATTHPTTIQIPDQIRFAGKYTISYRNFALTLLLLFTFILYSGSLSNQFLIGWDDGEYLADPLISSAGTIDMPGIFSSFSLGMYQPLAVLSFALNFKISGEVAWPYILINILLHLANSFLVFRLAERWMKGWVPGIIAATLFAIHPMHVEAVAWISTRSSGLYSLFFLLGLLAWDKYQQNSRMKYYLLALLFALLSLFSKSMAATLPLVLLLMDYLKKRPFSKKLIIEKIPFLALSVLFGVVAIKAAASFGHITELETDYSLLQRFFLILYALGFYFIKFIFPVNLSAIYAFPDLVNGQLPFYVYFTAIVPVAAAVIVWVPGRNRHEFTFSGLFFLLTLSMVLPLFWSRVFITADRYTYLPYLGLSIIIARWLNQVWESRRRLEKSTWRYAIAATVLIFISLSAATASRTRIWRDTPLLLADVIENKRSDADLAHAYFYLGNYYDAADKVDDALKYYNLALSRNSTYLLALNNRGIIKGKTGNLNSAIKDFDAAIESKPDYAEAYYNRGLAVYQTGEVEKACADWQEAFRLDFKPAREALIKYCGNPNGLPASQQPSD